MKPTPVVLIAPPLIWTPWAKSFTVLDAPRKLMLPPPALSCVPMSEMPCGDVAVP